MKIKYDSPQSIIKKSKNLLGFTYIELLIVVVAMSLLFGLGYANYRDFSNRKNMQRVADTVVGDLRLAQELAFAGNKPSGFCTTSTLDGYYFRRNSDTSYQIEALCADTSTQVYKTQDKIFSELDVTMPIMTQSPLLFKVLGQGTNAMSTTVTIYIRKAGYSDIQIKLNKNGEISY